MRTNHIEIGSAEYARQKVYKVSAVFSRRIMRRTIIPIALLYALIGFVAANAMAVGATSSYDKATKTLTVMVTSNENWDDLEVQVDDNDVKADFTTPTANWTVDMITDGGTNGKDSFIRLKRSSPISSNETVKITTTKKGRGKKGTIQVTLNNAKLVGVSGATLTSTAFGIPAVSEWGLVVMALLLLVAGGVVLYRWRGARRAA